VLLKAAEMFIGQCSEGEVVNEWLYKVIAQRRLELSTKVLIHTQEYQTFITPD
jgi:hypothetical protein